MTVNSTPSGSLRATLTLLLVAFLWSLGGVMIKWIDLPPLAIAGGRSAVAAVVILLAFPQLSVSSLRISSWSRHEVIASLAYAATVSTFVVATKLTTAANAILLQYTAPIYVALFGAWYLGERATRSDWMIIAVALGGMALFFLEDLSFSGLQGNLIALASGIAFAWVAISFRKLRDKPTQGVLITGNLLTLLIALPVLQYVSLGSLELWQLLLLGSIQLGLPYVLYSWAIRHVRAIDALLIMVIEPVLNPVWVLLAYGERPSLNALFGGVIVLGAVITRGVLTLKRPRPPARLSTTAEVAHG